MPHLPLGGAMALVPIWPIRLVPFVPPELIGCHAEDAASPLIICWGKEGYNVKLHITISAIILFDFRSAAR